MTRRASVNNIAKIVQMTRPFSHLSLPPATAYLPHKKLLLQRVQPPNPFAGRYEGQLSLQENRVLKGFLDIYRPPDPDFSGHKDIIHHCLSPESCRPLPCNPIGKNMQIEILKKLAGYNDERGGGPTLLVCKGLYLASQTEVKTVFLKIYDPLYYPYEDEFGNLVSPVTIAEHDFTVEAAAYEQLSPVVKGGFIPKYYGSWITKVPIPETFSDASSTGWRHLFAVAMELVPGIVLKELKPDKYSQDARLNLAAKVFEAYATIHHAGVLQNDLAARNVICSTEELASPALNITVFDFNDAIVLPLLGFPGPFPPAQLPNSWRRVTQVLGGMKEWLPLDDVNDERWNQWLLSQKIRNKQ